MTDTQHAITDRYKIVSHGGIACSIIHLHTGYEQHMQGDEAQMFMDDVDEVYLTVNDDDAANKIVNLMCEEYFE